METLIVGKKKLRRDIGAGVIIFMIIVAAVLVSMTLAGTLKSPSTEREQSGLAARFASQSQMYSFSMLSLETRGNRSQDWITDHVEASQRRIGEHIEDSAQMLRMWTRE